MISKIETKEEADKRKKRNQILLGIGLVALMILSTVGYSLMNNDDSGTGKKTEKGITFVKQNGVWNTNINSNPLTFQYLPSEVSNISVTGQYSLSQYSGKPLYFTILDEGAREILNILQPYALRFQDACLEGTNCTGESPIKTCDDNIIIPQHEGETKVYQNKNCVYLTGDTTKASDAFLYKLLGIN